MRKIVLTAGFILASSMTFAQPRPHLTKAQISAFDVRTVVSPELMKTEPKMNRGTKIIVSYDGEWPVEMKGAFEHAVKIWEQNLPMSLPIRIHAVLSESLPAGTPSTVTMTTHDFSNKKASKTLYPTTVIKSVSLREQNLYNSIHTFANVDGLTDWFDSSDIEIFYNRDMLKEFSFCIAPHPGDKYDFVTLALRDIATGLGFQSRFRADTTAGRLIMPDGPLTPFEQKIFRALGSPSDPSEAYRRATKGSLDLGWGINLYAPETFENGISLCTTVTDDDMPLSNLLRADGVRDYVTRNLGNCNWTALFADLLGWRCDINPTREKPSINENLSSDVTIPYEGEFKFRFSSSAVDYPVISESTKRTFTNIPESGPSVSIGEYCEPFSLGRDETGLKDLPNSSKLIVSVQKKDGSWETVTSMYLPKEKPNSLLDDTLDKRSMYSQNTEPITLRLDTISFKEPVENYARSAKGDLKYRFVKSTNISKTDKPLYSYKVQYLSRDYLPQKPGLGYSGIFDESEEFYGGYFTPSDEYFINVRIGISNIEGVNYAIVNQTDEGYNVPFRYDAKEFKDGFFIANLDRECSTKLGIKYFNENGATYSDEIYIPALGFPETEEVDLRINRDRISIKGLSDAMLERQHARYEIYSAINPAPICSGTLPANGDIDISPLAKGIYVVAVYNDGKRIGSRKFIKQ